MTPPSDALVPYRLPFPPDAAEEILVPGALDGDERLWVPQSDSVAFRPLVMHVAQGWYANLLRVRGGGLLNRHRHVMPVTGLVLRGS